MSLKENSKFRSATGAGCVSGRCLWLALLGCLVLLGFAATYAFAGRSHAATQAVTTLPKPDPPPPPPPPPARHVPPPPPPPVSPPPPPPPPPAPAPAPPPPPAAVVTPRATAPPPPVVRQHPKQRPKKKARAKTQPATPVTKPNKPVKRAKPPVRAVSPRVRTVSAVKSSSTPIVVPLGLGLAFALSIVLAGLALTPFRRLPRAAQMVAYDRREPLLYSGIVIYITTGVSLVIALLMS
jgi:outer membrane biosynthesis protein TonB